MPRQSVRLRLRKDGQQVHLPSNGTFRPGETLTVTHTAELKAGDGTTMTKVTNIEVEILEVR